MTTPLPNNQLDPRERALENPFNEADTQVASAEQMSDDEGIDLDDQELTDDEIADDDDNS